MIIPDLNLLLFAHGDAFPLHEPARRWWTETLEGSRPVGLVGPVVFGFIRLATSRRVFTTPMPITAARACVESWLDRPMVRYLPDGPEHVRIALALLAQRGTAGNLTTDALIAAHARLEGGVVYTHDADFAGFPDVASTDPLRG
jgi:toxin-antitoxin system PIN domain toxin